MKLKPKMDDNFYHLKMVSICFLLCGPIHRQSVTRINYYLMMGVEVVYSTWTPKTDEEKRLFLIVQKRLPPSKISASDLPQIVGYSPSYNAYYHSDAVIRGLPLVSADVTVKCRTSWGLGNIEPLIRLINEHPGKIISCNILTRTVKQCPLAITDCLFAMKTTQQIAAWNRYKEMIKLEDNGNDPSATVPSEVRLATSCLWVRGITPDMNIIRDQMKDNYIIFNVADLEPALWFGRFRGVIDEWAETTHAHNTEDFLA
jgi:hypothetical protein